MSASPKTTVSNTADGCPVMGRTSQEVGVMPKETINNRYLVPNQLTGEGPQPDQITSLHVGWDAKQGTAQVSITRLTPEVSFSVDLDRDGINRLIRALRRARDAAFGADA